MTTVAASTLYLSRLLLNRHSRRVWSELAWPYEMHRTLMHAFEHYPLTDGANARERFRILFRADEDEGRESVTVYIQSAVEPDWSYLATLDDYLLVNTDQPNPACKEVTEAYKKLQRGQVFSFRLRANPTKRIARPSKGDERLKGKRVGLLREEEQIDWLIRKGHEREKGRPGGFEILMKKLREKNDGVSLVPCVTVRPEGKQLGRKRVKGRSRETTHLAVRFDGLLRVTDLSAFRKTLASGIGSAKAFGFGLLSLAPR